MYKNSNSNESLKVPFLSKNYLRDDDVHILVLGSKMVQQKLRDLSTLATTSHTRDDGNAMCFYFGQKLLSAFEDGQRSKCYIRLAVLTEFPPRTKRQRKEIGPILSYLFIYLRLSDGFLEEMVALCRLDAVLPPRVSTSNWDKAPI